MFSNINFGNHRGLVLFIGTIALLLFAYLLGWMTTSEEYGFLPLVLILGFFGAFIIFAHPTLGFALLLFLVPLGPMTRLIGGERAITFALGAFLLGMFACRVLALHEKIKFDRVSLYASAFLAWGLIASAWSPNPGASIKFAIRLAQMVGLYVLIFNYCSTRRQLDTLTLSFVGGALFAAAFSLVQGVNVSTTERVTFAEGYDPNYFSSIVSLSIILVFYYFDKFRHKLLRVLFILSTVIAGYVMIKAQSRAVWLALPLSLMLSSFLLYRNSKVVKYVGAIVITIVITVVSAYYTGIINESVISRLETLTAGDARTATSGRSTVLITGLEMIKENPIFGVGLNSFKRVYTEYAPPTSSTRFYDHRARGAHNTFLVVLAETGILGFIFFISIFIYIFRNIWDMNDAFTRFMFLWLSICLVLEGLTLVFYNVPWFWFILVLIVLRAKMDKQSDQRITPQGYTYAASQI